MDDRARTIGVPFLLFCAFGCEYETEIQYEDAKLVSEASGCPSPQSVSEEHHGSPATLASSERVERNPLCWYRVDDNGRPPTCPGAGQVSAVPDGGQMDASMRPAYPKYPTFDALRAQEREAMPSPDELIDVPRGGIRCASDGTYFVRTAPSATCEDTLDGTSVAELNVGRPTAFDVVVRELVASDARAPLTMCRYVLSEEVPRQPCSCGRSGLGTLQ